MKKYILAFLFGTFFSGCESDANLDIDHEPMIQVNATFIAGDSLPAVSVRRSFRSTGKGTFTIPASEILVSSASVQLARNSRLLVASQASPGVYVFAADSLLRPGEVLILKVQADGKETFAQTQVPYIDTTKYTVSISSLNRTTFYDAARRDAPPRNPVRETILIVPMQITVSQQFITDFTGAFITSRNLEAFQEEYYLPNSSFSSNNRAIQIFGDQFQGLASMLGKTEMDFYIKGSTIPAQPVEVKISMEIIVPDPFYAKYVRHFSDDAVPVTVTNVQGGVGMVIGAVKYRKNFTALVSLR